MKSFTNRWGLTVIILLIATGVVWLFGAAGFRIGDNFLLVRTGSVELETLEEGTIVYLNDKRERGKRNVDGGLVLRNVVPGTYTILVARDGYWPWIKKLNLNEQQALVLHPFTISKNPSETLITKSDKRYDEVLSRVLSEALPQKENKRTSKDGSTAIWVEGNNIMIEWLGELISLPPLFCDIDNICGQQLVVITTDEEIRSLDFYKSQPDVLIISQGNTLSVIDADPKNVQNIQPFYAGSEPSFAVFDDSTLYILDKNSLFILSL